MPTAVKVNQEVKSLTVIKKRNGNGNGKKWPFT
jgi:hypothetical protein